MGSDGAKALTSGSNRPDRSAKKETDMLKFIGGTVGIIFLIGLLVVIGILALIF
jgi:hypothetical protein